QARAAAGSEIHDVAGFQREATGRQRELGALARGPGFEQPDLGDFGGLLGVECERKVGKGDAAAVAGEAARFLDGRGIVTAGGDEGVRSVRELPWPASACRSRGARRS